MKIQSTNLWSKQPFTVNNYQSHKTHSPAFKGNKGAVVGGVAGSALITGALVTTIALSGPVGWIFAGWTALAGGVAGGVVGHNAEESIKEKFSRKK